MSNRSKLPNGDRVTELVGRFVANLVMSRSLYAAGGTAETLDPPGRDLDRECGYPTTPTNETYRRLYERWGIARRANDIWPDESWQVYPSIYETEDSRNTRFERAWDELNRKIPVGHYLHRADRLSGLGGHAVVLLGFDAGPMDSPVPGVNPDTGEPDPRRRPKKPLKLLYLRPFAEDHARVVEISTGTRFGAPVMYELSVADPSAVGVVPHQYKTIRVHWTRIIHVADEREESDVSGVPRLQPILNYLLDLRKVGGGSGEMFWKGAFPGYSFETIPDLLGESTMDEETVKEQVQEYMEGLKRYVALDGTTMKSLLPQIADPTPHITQTINMICATLKIPTRIFMGSETGHLASTQDSGNWNRRVAGRQALYLEPMVIRPFIDRLINTGILPTPAAGTYTISWSDLNTMSDKDKALVSLQRAQAIMQYATGKGETVIPVRQFLTLVLGYNEAQAAAIEKSLEANKAKMRTDPLGDAAAVRDSELAVKLEKAKPKPRVAGGGRDGSKPPRAPVGRRS